MTENPHTLTKITRFYRKIWKLWREKRFQKFCETIIPKQTDHLLDIGGYPFNWYSRKSVIGKVDVLNLHLDEIFDAPPNAPQIRALKGDARKLNMENSSYDIIFSNSVIEHVGNFSDQQDFAREARRVGMRLWIQTPAYECPIEPHYLGLFIHWFPPPLHAKLARWFSIRGLVKSTSSEDLTSIAKNTRLLTKNEMLELFPDCEIWTEYLLYIFPKSYVAIRRY